MMLCSLIRTGVLSAFLFALLSPSVTLAATPSKDHIIIGFNPTENADVVETNGKAFGEYFKNRTGISVKTFIATDYTALIEALRSGQVDFAFLPPFSYVKAEQIAGAKVLMKSVRKGKAVFYSAIITRTDKNIRTVEDLRGKNIAWVDPSSASGHIFPKANLIVKKGLDPDTFFGKQMFAGSHDAAVLAVVNGTVDAAATFCNDPKGTEGAWTQFLKGDEAKKITAVFVTDPITGDTMAASKQLASNHDDVVKMTTKLLGEMGGNAEGQKILKALYRIEGMVPATNADYDSVRKAAKVVKVD